MDISVYWLIPTAIGFFAFGILFGRKNKNKADALAAAANKAKALAEAELAKLKSQK